MQVILRCIFFFRFSVSDKFVVTGRFCLVLGWNVHSFNSYWCRLGFESLIGDVLVDPACLGRSL